MPRGFFSRSLRLLAVLGLMVPLLTTCGGHYALMLKVRATKASYLVEVFDLRVKQVGGDNKVVLERLGEKVDAGNPKRNIAEPGQELQLLVEFGEAGNYLVYILGRSGRGTEGQQFFLRDFEVKDVVEEEVQLIELRASQDQDSDGFPGCKFAQTLPCGAINCEYLDCDDGNESIHPFAEEQCENGKDDDCSAGCSPPAVAAGQRVPGDAVCVDADGDGVPADKDCDDNDPCRSPQIEEARDTCHPKSATWGNTEACKKKLAAEGKSFSPPFCGDGIDQDCDGQDVACFTDKDCDGFAAPADCDDNDNKINPGVAEVCDGKDNNCNETTDEGCTPCDVDGDRHAAKDYQGVSCDFPKDDPDDYDAGIHPGTTEGGVEGGTVLGALRGYCSTVADKNGSRQRDVDHDGDGLAAQDDGCPAEECDADHDGFKSASCNPPASEKDCDDNNPQAFPGAPANRSTAVDENCSGSDAACPQSADKDGDGYCPPADCDDNNRDVHPWAKEICDRLDNDCDGLVDEGNPDAEGNLLSTNKRQCNDDNDGKCAPKNGICACSPVDTRKVYAIDLQNRTACAGEDLAKPASPRCFGAPQPSREHCDDGDWNCDGHPVQPGEDFIDKGKPCSITRGTCVAGTVESCNLSKTDSGANNIRAVVGEYSEHWQCSSGTVLPQPEICDGKDNDCDGVLGNQSGNGLAWPEVDEGDRDGDKYLACSGDCNDLNGNIHPGAEELCNNIDDNCVANDDGATQCTGGDTCCSTQKACRDLQTEFENCGTCGKVCPSNTTDRCTAGQCRCGGSAPCGPGLRCSGGSCICDTSSGCTGCCSGGDTCLTSSNANCGQGGAVCQSCSNGQRCVSGSCGCDAMSCPAGCCDGKTCRAWSDSTCGPAGGSCQSCSSGQRCVSGSCNCDATSCPAGCCSGKTCRAWSNSTCGPAGGSCTACSTGTRCSSGSCVCDTSSGCSGCCSGNACLASASQNCGTGGEACQSCGTGQRCASGNCVCDTSSGCSGCCDSDGVTCRTSSSSTCGTGGEACQSCGTGQRCASGNCICDTSSGCGGCCDSDGVTCRSSNDEHCGSGGEGCQTCGTNQRCVSGNCVCDATSCPAGCCSGATCILYGSQNDNTCGKNGNDCAKCADGTSCDTSNGECIAPSGG